MTTLNFASTIAQYTAIFAAILATMIIFGRRRPPVPLQSMNDGALDELGSNTGLELKTFEARDGTKLAYREFISGSDQVAILIHGSSADGRAMQAIGQSLAAQSISAYALDMRGHGASGRRGDIDYVGQLEDDVADFVKYIRVSHPHAKLSLVGHSSGGGFSLRFACGKSGTLFDHYVLAAPFLHHAAPTTRPGSGGWARPFMPRLIALTILDVIGLKLFQYLPVLAFAVPEGRSDLTGFYSFRLQSNFRPDTMKWKEHIKNLQRPVDVIVGENDELFVASAYAPLLTPLTPHILVKVLPGLGHVDIYASPLAKDTIVSLVKLTN
ncbi:MAG: alpha/beta hydrolase [Burkholderiaceae bacterium]